MFEITIINTTLYGLSLACFFYLFFCFLARKIITPKFRKLLYYISLFSLFGVIGEAFTNTLYAYFFGAPLWEYRLFPAHDGDITYFFIFVWGVLGLYTYFRNIVFRKSATSSALYSGLILGAEAILIELFVNGAHFLLFNEYVFYYFPANLGPLSHFSCLQVVPFYIIVGYITGRLIEHQEILQYRNLRTTLGLYWMILITFDFF